SIRTRVYTRIGGQITGGALEKKARYACVFFHDGRQRPGKVRGETQIPPLSHRRMSGEIDRMRNWFAVHILNPHDQKLPVDRFIRQLGMTIAVERNFLGGETDL